MRLSPPQQEILSHLDEWERLTGMEWEAIQAGAWENVSRCQKEKETLQTRIDDIFESHAHDHSGGAVNLQAEPAIRERAQALMLLESRNKDAVEEIRQAISGEMAETDKAFRHLRQIKKSYSQPAGTSWNQYG